MAKFVELGVAYLVRVGFGLVGRIRCGLVGRVGCLVGITGEWDMAKLAELGVAMLV